MCSLFIFRTNFHLAMALYTKSYAWKRYLAMLTFLVALQYVFNIFGLAQLPPLAQAAQVGAKVPFNWKDKTSIAA